MNKSETPKKGRPTPKQAIRRNKWRKFMKRFTSPRKLRNLRRMSMATKLEIAVDNAIRRLDKHFEVTKEDIEKNKKSNPTLDKAKELVLEAASKK